jgi:hypothetical protein
MTRRPRADTAGGADAAARLAAVALAIAVTDPPQWVVSGIPRWLLAIAMVTAALWAAPPVVRRPAGATARLVGRAGRHRNTLFAVGCTAVAATGDPRPWPAGVDAALLLAYLLAVDAAAAGPVGARQLRRCKVPFAAAGASAITLLGAFAPVATGALWGRAVAAAAVAFAGLAVGAALWVRRDRGSRATGANRARGGRRD